MFLCVLIPWLINYVLGLMPGGKIKLVKSGAIFLQMPKRHVSYAFFFHLLQSDMLLFAVTVCFFLYCHDLYIFLILLVLNWNLFLRQSLGILSKQY